MTIRIGLIGSGWGLGIQTPCFRSVGLEVQAVWARTPEKAQQVAAQYRIPDYSSNPEDILRSPNVDVVSIVVPPHLHAELALAALEAGKHVLCEKPTALNSSQARQMLLASQAHPRQLAILDHEMRFLPAIQAMQRLLQEGYLGRILHAGVLFSVDSRLDVTRSFDWKSDRSLGGGLLGAVGSHFVDILSWLLTQRVESVSANLQVKIPRRPAASGELLRVTADDYSMLQLQFQNGVSANIHLSYVTAGPGQVRFFVSGEQGSLVFERGRLSGYRFPSHQAEDLTPLHELALPAGLPLREWDHDWATGALYLGRALRLALETGDLQHAALAPAATFEDGLHTQQVIDAAWESSQSRGWVNVGP